MTSTTGVGIPTGYLMVDETSTGTGGGSKSFEPLGENGHRGLLRSKKSLNEILRTQKGETICCR